MSGGGIIDSFKSSDPTQSNNGLYDVTKLHIPPNYYGAHGDVGSLNGASSDLKSTYIYGSLGYNGTAVKNTTNVQGAISTPFSATVSDTSAPSWSSGYTTYSGGSPPFATAAAGTKSHPTLIKVTGNLTVPGGQTLTITAPNSGNDNNYITIWVTGNYTTSGSGAVSQAAGVKATWYIGGSITTSGSSYTNADNVASAVSFIGYGPAGTNATISGSGAFVGTLNIPNYDLTISGSGGLTGAVIAGTLNISGGASLHYDEALNNGGGSASVGNYAFASWFEDNSDTARSIIY